MTETAKERAVYARLQDTESKEIFMQRKKWTEMSMGGGKLDIFWYKSAFIKELDHILQNERFILYGYGGAGKTLYQYYRMLSRDRPDGGSCVEIWDQYAGKREEKPGEPRMVCPPSMAAEITAVFDRVIITPAAYEKYYQMKNRCLSIGIAKEKIFLLKKFPDQYFDPDIIHFEENEVMIDGGCYDFSDSMDMIRIAPCVKRIYAFEPNAEMYEIVKANAEKSGFSHYSLQNKALWHCDEELSFAGLEEGASSVSEAAAGAKVQAISLDNSEASKETVTFVKLDIEGSELMALRGMSNIIKRDKPKLAICIYHKPEDYYEIGNYILELVPAYKLYIRHYHYSPLETVLYAVL